MRAICGIKRYSNKEAAEAAVKLLRASGIKASTDAADLGHRGLVYGGRGAQLWVFREDTSKADEVLKWAMKFGNAHRKQISLPPEEGTLEYLDMLIHDCRQYLMIATGELKSIEEEGTLDLDEPTNDPYKLMIRLRRLKEQCMRMAGRVPLDWQHGGGLDE